MRLWDMANAADRWTFEWLSGMRGDWLDEPSERRIAFANGLVITAKPNGDLLASLPGVVLNDQGR